MAKIIVWMIDGNESVFRDWATDEGIALEKSRRDFFSELLILLTFQVSEPEMDLIRKLEEKLKRGDIERYQLWDLIPGDSSRIIDRIRWNGR